MNTELMKAVERVKRSLHANYMPSAGVHVDVEHIEQVLRDLEAENARLTQESAQRFIRGREWAELSGRQESRAEKAEALLRECNKCWIPDDALLFARITAHLGADHG